MRACRLQETPTLLHYAPPEIFSLTKPQVTYRDFSQDATTLTVYRVVVTVFSTSSILMERRRRHFTSVGRGLFCDRLVLCRNQGDVVFTEMVSREMRFTQEIVVT